MISKGSIFVLSIGAYDYYGPRSICIALEDITKERLDGIKKIVEKEIIIPNEINILDELENRKLFIKLPYKELHIYQLPTEKAEIWIREEEDI